MIYDLVFIVVGIYLTYINWKGLLDLEISFKDSKYHYILANVSLLMVWVSFLNFNESLKIYLS